MSSNIEITTQNKDNIQKNDEYAPKKFKKVDVIIFIVCIVLAFAFWCYAQFLHDPIIEKTILVQFVLVGGEANESITPTFKQMNFFGKQSALEKLEYVTFEVQRSAFTEYNVETEISMSYPDEFHADVDEVFLMLLTNNEQVTN